MKLLVNPSKISGIAEVPGSKSHTIRGVLSSILANGESILKSPLSSADTVSALNAAEKFGASFHIAEDGSWHIHGIGSNAELTPQMLDLGNSGTSLRLLTAGASIFNAKISLK